MKRAEARAPARGVYAASLPCAQKAFEYFMRAHIRSRASACLLFVFLFIGLRRGRFRGVELSKHSGGNIVLPVVEEHDGSFVDALRSRIDHHAQAAGFGLGIDDGANFFEDI